MVEPGSGRADPSNADKEAPIADDLTFFVGDWDPIKTCAGIIENTTTGRYSKVCPLPGVFHEFVAILQEDKPSQRGLGLIFFNTNSFVTILSWIYWLGTHAFNANLVSFLIAPFYAKADNKKATDNNLVEFNEPITPERE